MRRLAVALLALAGVVVAAVSLAAPAAVGQTVPPATLTIDTFQTGTPNGCANPGQRLTVTMGGQTNQGSVSIVLYSPSGSAINKATGTVSSGRWSASIGWAYDPPGIYEFRASAGGATASAFMEVPCQAPTLEYAPTCFSPGYSGTVTMTARHFPPYGTGYIYYDKGGSEAQTAIRLPVDGHGNVSATFKVTPSNRDHPGEANNAQSGGPVATAVWSPCPPGSTAPPTTSTTTTTTVPTVDTTTTLPPATIPTPTTRPGATTTTLLVTTTTLLVPPPTPGATLTVNPTLGTPGFVALATGTGFAPGPLQLTWAPGIGSFAANAGPDGTFTAQVLVFPHDRLGPRTLVATGGAVTATAPFLVVPNTVHPSGKDVTQITRLRSFNQR